MTTQDRNVTPRIVFSMVLAIGAAGLAACEKQVTPTQTSAGQPPVASGDAVPPARPDSPGAAADATDASAANGSAPTTSQAPASAGLANSASAVAPAPGAVGPDSARSTDVKAVDDDWITLKIKSTVLAMHGVDASDIKFATRQHVLTLTGTASNQRDIDRIVAAARGVEGVKQVDSQVTVKH